MSQQELLKKVIEALDQSRIQYMLTGSIVSSLQGEPRSTHDIDVIIAIQRPKAKAFLDAFPATDFYLERESILEAIRRQSMFSLIDLKGGGKVDFWMLTREAFDQSRFKRRYEEPFMGIRMRVSSPEDTILAKLRWAKLSGGSEKQFTDALRVYEVQFGNLDLEYLDQWVKKLDVDSLWKRLKGEAETG
jgi:hypothetical protein